MPCAYTESTIAVGWTRCVLTIALTFVIFLVGTESVNAVSQEARTVREVASSSRAYVIGPDDVLNINVLKHPEFSCEILVPSGGFVELPGIGRVKVAGMTLMELSDYVTEHLKHRLQTAEVTVSLKIPRMKRVYILGEVRLAGSAGGGPLSSSGVGGAIDWKPGWRITEALSAAGGINSGVQESDISVTILHYASGLRESVPLAEVLHGAPSRNLPIDAGDVVAFEAGELLQIYVTGKVKVPGMYRLPKVSNGLLEAIAMAGGLDVGSASANIRITHTNGDSDKIDISQAVLHGDKAPQVSLRPGDLIMVPESQGKIAVLGLVKAPGLFAIEDGKKVTLTEAIAQAQGHDIRRARMSKVGLVHIRDGKSEHFTFDVGRYLRTGDSSQNPLIQAGDVIYVPETNSIDWQVVLSTLTTTAVAIYYTRK